MGSKTATAERNQQRAATTADLMKNIMTGGEISKAREKQLQEAADYGRGIQFVPSGSVKGLTQRDGSPVARTGVSAADYTGRFTASPPTFMEILGDAKRALVGGQAPTPSYIQSTRVDAPTAVAGPNAVNYAGFLPTPTEQTGILAPLAEKFLVPGGLALNIAKDLYGKIFPGQQDDTQPIVDLRKPTIEEQVTSYVGIDPYVEKRNTLKQIIAGSQAPGASELNVDEMSDTEVDLRLQSYGQGFAMGGLTRTIPPESGPKPQGIASLYKNK